MHHYRQALLRMRQGESDREIAAAKLMGRPKAAQWRRLATEQGWLDPAQPLPDDEAIAAVLSGPRRASSTVSTLESHRACVAAWLEQGVSGTAIHAALRRQFGWKGSYSSVRRLAADIRSQLPPETTCRLDFEPGDAAQVDFGAGPTLVHPDGQPRRTWAFVMTLAHSRHQYVEFVWDQTVATWLGCHRRAFEWFGGRACARDHRQRQVRHHVKRLQPTTPLVQRAYAECAEGYGFKIDALPAARPAEEGDRRVRREVPQGQLPAADAQLPRPGRPQRAGPRLGHGRSRSVRLPRHHARAHRWLCTRWSAPLLRRPCRPSLPTWAVVAPRECCTATATSSTTAPALLRPLRPGGQDAVAARHRHRRGAARGLPARGYTHLRAQRPGQRLTRARAPAAGGATAFFERDRRLVRHPGAAPSGPTCTGAHRAAAGLTAWPGAAARRPGRAGHELKRYGAGAAGGGVRSARWPTTAPHYRTVKTILASGADRQPLLDPHTPAAYGRARFTRSAAAPSSPGDSHADGTVH